MMGRASNSPCHEAPMAWCTFSPSHVKLSHTMIGCFMLFVAILITQRASRTIRINHDQAQN
ncbi:hypothetical protein BDZ85DRAFT_268244 [Elsinoe ampelina]|uniref:Uncharacterized protein n=1 Tax=Elsinoe ampelina TaxID=302913 RepID=A0A6A6G1Y2_9PEZI|nr:hypothetical protein BDZ85DRAFT_268244 [Elsinoe ampelina]